MNTSLILENNNINHNAIFEKRLETDPPFPNDEYPNVSLSGLFKTVSLDRCAQVYTDNSYYNIILKNNNNNNTILIGGLRFNNPDVNDML